MFTITSSTSQAGEARAHCLRKLLPACLALAATHATAATSTDNPEPTIETVIVTAHRTPISTSDASSSVSLIDRSLIDQRQSTFATDLLRNLPSVAVSRTAGFGSQTQVRIRGAEANHVLVMIDGVEANDPAGPDEFDFAALTTFDIESIELVRGPQSALWGSDATAGVINITTRRSNKPLDAAGFVEGGSFGTAHGGARLSASNDRGGIDLGISHLDTQGTVTVANGNEKDGNQNTTATLRGRWEPAENADLSIFARYTDASVEFDDFDFSTGLPADADRTSDDQLLLLGAKGSLTLFDERWQHALRMTYLDSDHDRTADGIDSGSTAAEKLGVYYQSTLLLGSASEPSQHRLTLAIDHEQEEFSQRGPASAFGDPNQDQELDNTGYIAEYIGQPFPGASISASVRHDDNSDFADVTTYRVTAAYQLPKLQTRLRGSFGTGQKSPTFVERFGFFADQFVGNPELNPEKSTGFEVGISQPLWQGRLRADVVYFNEELEDEINGFVFDLDAFAFTAQNTGGKSQREGVEVQLAATLTQNLSAEVSYTYTDSTQPDPLGDNVDEVRRPKHMAALNLNLAFLNTRGNANLNVTHSGEQTDDFFAPPFFTQERVTLDAYTLVDVAVSFALSPRLTVYARAENLLDEDYSNVLGFSAPGRGAYAGIRFGL